MFFPLPRAQGVQRTIHINTLSSPQDHTSSMKRTKDSHLLPGLDNELSATGFTSFFSAYLKLSWTSRHSSAISVSGNLQGLNIWNMLIQFYTKFGIGIESENSKWYGDETSKISHQIYWAKMVKSDTSAKIRPETKNWITRLTTPLYPHSHSFVLWYSHSPITRLIGRPSYLYVIRGIIFNLRLGVGTKISFF